MKVETHNEGHRPVSFHADAIAREARRYDFMPRTYGIVSDHEFGVDLRLFFKVMNADVIPTTLEVLQHPWVETTIAYTFNVTMLDNARVPISRLVKTAMQTILHRFQDHEYDEWFRLDGKRVKEPHAR